MKKGLPIGKFSDMETKDIWEEQFQIRASETDLYNRLKVSSVFRLIQDVASEHANNLRVGYDDFLPKGLFWALSWSKLELLSYPNMGEKIKVRTWPKDVYKLYALRDLYLIDHRNEIFCKCATAWLIVNMNSRRIVNPSSYLMNIKKLRDKHALTDLPRKIDAASGEETRLSKKILYSDIDVNMHVNNANYADYIFDAYPEAFFRENLLKSIEISFKAELKLGDSVSIKISEDQFSQSAHFVSGERSIDRKPVFAARLNWSKIEP